MEIEIKVKLENISLLKKFLEQEGDFILSSKQRDEYYTPAYRNFVDISPIEEWLRLRDSNGKFSVNYKKWHYEKDKTSNYADEFETEISDLDEMKKIFAVLDFRPLVTVEKQRSSWNYKDYEISIDSIKELGEFVEIEYTGRDTNPKEITDQMITFLTNLQCGSIERDFKGYPYLLLETNNLL